MMILSRIELDLRQRAVMKALASPNLIHGAIEQSFPGPRGRRLWRVDTLGDKTWLLVLSQDKPDFGRLAAQFGAAGWESREYEPLLRRIESGSVWHFRLTANPTVSKSGVRDERGKVLGHITPTHQKRWLSERAEKHGFSVSEEEFDVVQSRWLRFRKGTERGRPVTLLSVTYEGRLTITDPVLFIQTLTEGLGRGKAYGLGLLTVAQRRI